MSDRRRPRREQKLALLSFDYFDKLLRYLQKPNVEKVREAVVEIRKRLGIREPARRLKDLALGDRRAWAEVLIDTMRLPGGELFFQQVLAASPFKEDLFAVIGPAQAAGAAMQVAGHGEPVIAALAVNPGSVESFSFPPYYFFAIPKPP